MPSAGVFFHWSIRLALVNFGLWVCVTAAPADQRRKGKPYNNAAVRDRQREAAVKAATAQLNAARQVLAAAEAKGDAAQSKLDAALAKLRDEAERFHDAQSITRHLAKELAEIESEILDEQKEDSAYTKASKQVETARQKLATVEDRVLQDPATVLNLSGLTGSKLADARASILGIRAEYIEAKNSLETEASTLARIRSELYQSDADWKAAAEALTQARKEEREAEDQTRSGTSARISSKVTAKNAAEAATAARAAIAQAQAVLKANDGKNNDPKRDNKSKKKNKK